MACQRLRFKPDKSLSIRENDRPAVCLFRANQASRVSLKLTYNFTTAHGAKRSPNSVWARATADWFRCEVA